MEKEPGLIVNYQSWWVGDGIHDRAGGYSGSELEIYGMGRPHRGQLGLTGRQMLTCLVSNGYSNEYPETRNESQKAGDGAK